VVGPNQVLVLLRKDGTRSLPTDEVIVPRPAGSEAEPEKFQKWKERYGDCNGIIEQVYLPGTYFGFSPFDYERYILPVTR
jgi:hypothetical protein